MLSIDRSLAERWPGTVFGAVCVDAFSPTPGREADFARRAGEVLALLRSENAGYERRAYVAAHADIAAYVRFYRKFKKSYYVLGQLESAISGRDVDEPLATVRPLFLTELETGVLLAGHDCDASRPPFTLRCAEGGESFTRANGETATLKRGDVLLCGEDGPVTSLVYGGRLDTLISAKTRRLLYLIIGVPGLERASVERAAAALERNIRLLAPEAEIETELVEA